MVENLASYIDHTLLKSTSKEEDILLLCQEAMKYNFFSVCLHPCYLPFAQKILKDSKVKLCTVIGFPLGCNGTENKLGESLWSIENNAQELDVVINTGWLKMGENKRVEDEIKQIVQNCPAIIKVILETCYLTEDEIIRACKISQSAGAHFVKTSTGFGTDGASVDVVRIMRKSVDLSMKIKASGGIRTAQQALAMIEAGANRLGLSQSVKILKEWQS